MNNVVVIGGNHHNTLGVIRSLGRKGISPYVILIGANNDSFVSKSKYINETWIVSDIDLLIDFILSKYCIIGKSVLIACCDSVSELLDRNQTRLSDYFFLPCTNREGFIREISNKFIMSKMASKIGLNIPFSSEISIDRFDDVIGSIIFPCITKPIYSASGSKSDIVVCNNKDELYNILVKAPKRNFLVQEFLIKKYEFQFIGCSLNNGQEVYIPGVSELIRPSDGSNTGFLKYVDLNITYSEVYNKTKELIKETGYSGLFSVEFIRTYDNVDYFLEINFRNDGNSISVTNAGVNLPFVWYQYSLGLNYIDEVKRRIHIEFVMPEFQELILWYSFKLSTSKFLYDFWRTTSYMDYDRNDPAPTKGWRTFIRLLIKFSVKRMLKYFLRIIK